MRDSIVLKDSLVYQKIIVPVKKDDILSFREPAHINSRNEVLINLYHNKDTIIKLQGERDSILVKPANNYNEPDTGNFNRDTN